MKKTVLFVEDEHWYIRLLKNFFNNIYEVSHADTVSNAKKELDSKNIDAIVLDISLKNEDCGLDFVKYVRENSNYDSVPIILLSAHGRKNVEKELQENYDISIGYECDLFVQKPVNHKKLRQIIDKQINYKKNK